MHAAASIARSASCLGNWQRVCFRGGSGPNHDVPAGLDDTIKGASVKHEILDRRECGGAERLNPDGVSFFKSPHIENTFRKCPHVGFALTVLDEKEAQRVFKALRQLDQLEELKGSG
jgi:hypothetical protein